MSTNHNIITMKKLSTLVLAVLFIGLCSCRDSAQEQKDLDANLDKIEAVEQEVDETTQDVEQKAEEVESALNDLDNL